MKRLWIIFDMDNTLIDTQPLYWRALDSFCDLMVNEGFDREEVRSRHQIINANLHDAMGYMAECFPRSLELVVEEFAGKTEHWISLRLERIMKAARSIGMDVHKQKSPEYQYSLDAVRKAMSLGYKTAVITAGERWVQERRFNELSMRDFFHDIWIVNKKEKQTFLDFCAKHDIPPDSSWMIGDSLKSDIIPATEAGLRTIHVQTSDWVARDSGLTLPNSAVSVKDLTEALAIIQKATPLPV